MKISKWTDDLNAQVPPKTVIVSDIWAHCESENIKTLFCGLGSSCAYVNNKQTELCFCIALCEDTFLTGPAAALSYQTTCKNVTHMVSLF